MLCTVTLLSAQSSEVYRSIGYEIVGKDTLIVAELQPVNIYARRGAMLDYAKLLRNIRIVYPIAVEAEKTLRDMEAHLLTLKTKKEQDQYIKVMEQILKKKYTPVLKKMTFSQGKILIKLIDRQTSQTSYALVKELRGNFSAFVYQGIARLFGANLKERYDKSGEDRLLEQLILIYEEELRTSQE